MGTLYGVGVGPGDPELLTLKAVRIIRECAVVAFHAGRSGTSKARSAVPDEVIEGSIEEELVYPVTTGQVDHPSGYAGAMRDFYEASASRLAGHLEQGRDVALLSEGDPLFYGSYMYMHDRLSTQFATQVVPGITSMSAGTAAAGLPLVRQTDVLAILPGTLPEPELARRLAEVDGAVIMKLGRRFPSVRRALESAGRLDDAVYVERASTTHERRMPVAEVDPSTVPYFSIILVAGDTSSRAVRHGSVPASARHERHAGTGDSGRVARPAEAASGEAPCGELVVVGLGPAGSDWLTPEAAGVLDSVAHVVGYGPYVARVPQRPGLQRHASGNTVEIERARLALDLALRGEEVAVVSGGDAGIFGMASAVLEAQDADDRYAAVRVRVVPGVSAVQAVAARAGAPIGADFAVLSLSDRLKPWSVIRDRLVALARADLVTAIYNPRSRARPAQLGEARRILLEHRPPDTVVVVGRAVGRDDEAVWVTTLGQLDPGEVDMKCLLIVGASSTEVTRTGSVRTPRYVR